MITVGGLLTFLVVCIILAIIGVVVVKFIIEPLAPPTSRYALTMLVVALLIVLALIQLVGYGMPPIVFTR